MLGDVHHQPQIVLDHLLAGLESPRLGETRDAQLLVNGEECVVADVVEVQLSDIGQQIGAGMLVLHSRPFNSRENNLLRQIFAERVAPLVHGEACGGRYLSGSTGLP